MCVLELACGTGLISQRLAGSVKSLEATDYAPEMIADFFTNIKARSRDCTSVCHRTTGF